MRSRTATVQLHAEAPSRIYRFAAGPSTGADCPGPFPSAKWDGGLGTLPAGVEISGARYQKRTSAPLLGDDFMRQDGWAQEGLARTQWVDDDSWLVAFYEIDDPGKSQSISDEGVTTLMNRHDGR